MAIERWWIILGLFAAGPLPLQAQGRVLIINDMEGLAGQDKLRSAFFPYPDYPAAQRLLAADVNAAVEGLRAGGAEVIHVWDVHGGRNPGPNLLPELLHPAARLAPLRQPLSADSVRARGYDAVAFVGFHAAAGSNGFAAHTTYPLVKIRVNDTDVTEIQLLGAEWGEFGVPIILVTGDDRLGEELRPVMPWIEYVVTKRSTSASTADLRSVDEVHAETRAAAKRAFERRAKARPWVFERPMRVAVRAMLPASLRALRGFPGLRYREVEGGEAEFSTSSMGEAWVGLQSVASIANQAYRVSLLREVVEQQPNGKQIMAEAAELYFDRWSDVEAGRWRPPPDTRP